MDPGPPSDSVLPPRRLSFSETGQQPLGARKAFYVSIDGPSEELAMLARAALAAPERRLALGARQLEDGRERRRRAPDVERGQGGVRVVEPAVAALAIAFLFLHERLLRTTRDA